MDDIANVLMAHGPSRSSLIAELLQEQHGLNPDAARKRLSRIVKPVVRFPIPLLPKREAFLYRLVDRNTERFWTNFLRDLRETNSVYGAAIDGMLARGGIVLKEDFPVISGAPVAQKGQVSADRVASQLIDAGFMTSFDLPDSCYAITGAGPTVGTTTRRARALAEGVLLDALREWTRKTGFASYNSIAIRGDARSRQVGPFVWDLTGPSYILPLRNGDAQPGFLVADVFADGTLDEFHIKYFIRKARMSKASLKGMGIFPILLADSFTSTALTEGHKAGIVMVTHETLFGVRVAESMRNLLKTLNNAAAMVSGYPERLEEYIRELSSIEGKAGNLRGILFHLLSAHLLRRSTVSIDIGKNAFDEKTGKHADIDIIGVTEQSAGCVLIECKGKQPGGIVEVDEVQDWLRRIPIFNAYIQSQPTLREADRRFELWTSGIFSADALALLANEKIQRTRLPIDWKDGQAVLALARAGKQKLINDTLFEHFLRHPLAEAASVLETAA
ncbi:hypothetical protein IVA93_31745 [Bradyrhizobium sp. 155]|uniref:hypothetical protein n=1 Tax=unclassified Bradyrhizobium TaxID=2631580 RepID=UPI001FFB26DD|nr:MULTISPECIES: hypothetical protein [unclassified Bradyrhizobium]MCK1409941.1 hypothetical protein [Bradyrhizobium sp. 76]UPK10729.1 hypothetical protein IVA93_31745 [Bradyrhizobium sp. 155]